MQVTDILEVFRLGTENMWDDINRTRFTAMARMINAYQTKIGGGLCALTVKLREWTRQFPAPEHAGPQKLAHFIAGEMRQGIELVEDVSFEDKPF